jgi:hypothetical protein
MRRWTEFLLLETSLLFLKMKSFLILKFDRKFYEMTAY